jgi:hypothetical protein
MTRLNEAIFPVNEVQKHALGKLQGRLEQCGKNQQLPVTEAEGCVFTRVDGVTVLIGPNGGYKIPAVRSYPETGNLGESALDAALDPSFFFLRQSKDPNFKTGHFTAIVGTDWKCEDMSCPCNGEHKDDRRRRSINS